MPRSLDTQRLDALEPLIRDTRVVTRFTPQEVKEFGVILSNYKTVWGFATLRELADYVLGHPYMFKEPRDA